MNPRCIKTKLKELPGTSLDLSKSLVCTNSHVRKAVIAHGRMKNYLTSTLLAWRLKLWAV